MASYTQTQSTKESIIPLLSKSYASSKQVPTNVSSEHSSKGGDFSRPRTSPKGKGTNDDRGQKQMNDAENIQILLTIPQVAQQLNVCRAHVYTLIKQGLPTIHLGRSVRVNPLALQNWLLELEANQ